MAVLDELRQTVVDGRADMAVAKATDGLKVGMAAELLLQDGLIAAMNEVGQLFEEGEIFVPEMLVAARAMNAALEVLKPRLADQGQGRSAGTVAIGTVQGDLHDIGKNLVAMMLEGSGFSVVDLGTDVPPERFIQAVRARAKVVAMSALLTTTMTNMKAIVDAVREAGLRHEVRIIVGGAPITARYAEEIGDDGYASDAPKAVRKVKELLGVQAEATTPSGGSNLL